MILSPYKAHDLAESLAQDLVRAGLGRAVRRVTVGATSTGYFLQVELWRVPEAVIAMVPSSYQGAQVIVDALPIPKPE